MKKQSFTQGVLYTLLSSAGLTFTGLLGQLLIPEMTLSSLVFWRFLSSLIFCTVLFYFIHQLKETFKFQNIKLHLLRAFFALVAQYAFYYYMEKNTLFNAIVLLNTGPLFIPILELLFLKERIGLSTWVGLIISFFGIVCILQPDKGIFTLTSFIGLLSGLGQGASQVVFGINSKAERTDTSVIYLFFFLTLFSLVPYLFFHSTWTTPTPPIGWVILLIALLAIASICNQLARAVAYQHSTPSRLSTFLYFSILLAGILEWALFDRAPNALSIVGAVLVILGGFAKIYLRAIILRRKQP